MQLQKRLLMLLALLLAVGGMSMTAAAHDVPQPQKAGTISVTMEYEGKRVPGGTLCLYRVAAVWEDDGNFSFTPTGDFVNYGGALTNVQSPQLAESLATYVEKYGFNEAAATVIGDDGKAVFSDLELGLYLLIQSNPAKGYLAAEPFLVSVPMLEDGVYVYEVDAGPKVELEKAPEPPVTPTPTKPSDSRLPYTGQLNWPIPIMAVLGLCLFAAGWLLRFGKKADYEK